MMIDDFFCVKDVGLPSWARDKTLGTDTWGIGPAAVGTYKAKKVAGCGARPVRVKACERTQRYIIPVVPALVSDSIFQ
jgi:hypothetical protein